jgi:hypothetical protein
MDTVQHTVIPLLRIFDVNKAREFYIGWLGFAVDWEHRFGENFPLYMQVSKDNIKLHLTEHYGDCCPGAKIFIGYAGDLRTYNKQLLEKDYRYYKPGINETPWDSLEMEVTDPFGNKIAFNEALKKEA